MTEEQFQLLEDFIQAKIEEYGCNDLQEVIRTNALRKDLRVAFGLSEYRPAEQSS